MPQKRGSPKAGGLLTGLRSRKSSASSVRAKTGLKGFTSLTIRWTVNSVRMIQKRPKNFIASSKKSTRGKESSKSVNAQLTSAIPIRTAADRSSKKV